MKIKLEHTEDQALHLATAANGKGKLVRVDRQALMNLLLSYSRIIKANRMEIE